MFVLTWRQTEPECDVGMFHLVVLVFLREQIELFIRLDRADEAPVAGRIFEVMDHQKDPATECTITSQSHNEHC